MHLSFHLDQHITEEEARRVANAVLAFGGVSPRFMAEFENNSARMASAEELRAMITKPSALVARTADDELLDSIGNHESAVEKLRAELEETTIHGDLDADVAAARFGVQSDGVVVEKGRDPRPATADEMIDAGHTITQGSGRYAESHDTLDKNGLPWDERIHSSSRNRNADGTWRMKRGVAAGFVAEVEQELRALLGVQAPSAPATPPPPPPPPPVPTAYTYANVVNLIASKKMQPEVYVAVIGESLPDFAKTCASNPAAAAEAYEKLSNL